MEHLLSHTEQNAATDDLERHIAGRYTGVNREHLRFLRRHCTKCTPSDQHPMQISLNTAEVMKYVVAGWSLCRSYMQDTQGTRGDLNGSDGTGGFSCGCKNDTGPTGSRPIIVAQQTQQQLAVNIVRYAQVISVICTDKATASVPTQQLCIRHTTAQSSDRIPTCFLPEAAKRLSKILGPEFIKVMDEETVAHQSVAVGSMMANHTGQETAFHTLTSLQKTLTNDISTWQRNTLFLLVSCDYSLSHSALRKAYELMRAFAPIELRMFPSLSEMEFVARKIGDIRALDQIAGRSRPRWSFRPKTCAETSDCTISTDSVLKRTYSCGSKHVFIRPTAQQESRLLPCKRKSKSATLRDGGQAPVHWFHQEYIEDLRIIGEFRVFVVTVKDNDALRGRKGIVVQTIHTIELPDKELAVTVIPPHRRLYKDVSVLTARDLDELHRFALDVFHQLRTRSDWLTHYESLEVGARLDVGVRVEGNDCRYFVNEVTRIYEADMFGDWLAKPGLSTCIDVARALAEVFFTQSEGVSSHG